MTFFLFSYTWLKFPSFVSSSVYVIDLSIILHRKSKESSTILCSEESEKQRAHIDMGTEIPARCPVRYAYSKDSID